MADNLDHIFFGYYEAANARKQQADPHAERKALEAALAEADEDLADKWLFFEVPKSTGRLLVEAARKHLETLPKPEPRDHLVIVKVGDRPWKVDSDLSGQLFTKERAERIARNLTNAIAVKVS